MQQSEKPSSLDFENVISDKKITEALESGEQIIFSWKVVKFTGSNKQLTRILVITNKNIYNIAPPDENNAVINFFQSLVNKSRIKRRIPLEFIGSVTVSKVNTEFIVHVPTEYDQRYMADNYRETILYILCDTYCKQNFKKLTFHFTEDLNLIQFTQTNYDKKKGIKRTLPPQHKMMDPEELKSSYSENKNRSRTIFQRNKQIKEVGMEDFSLIKVLGRGAFGKVMLCEKKDTKEIYAIKSLRKEDIITRDHVDYIKTERKILEQSHHPFLVSLEYAFQTEENVYFVMKFMKQTLLLNFYQRGGELFTHLQKMNRFNEQMTLFYSAQVLLALEYLHKLNVIYRDLKPENILMDEQGYVSLADYGLAKFLQKGQQAQSIVGTPEYLAPEVVTQQGHTFTADWWCLGILIYEMLCGRTPFFSENRNAMFRNICDNEIKFPNNVYLSTECKSLIQALLKKKPSDRLGARGDGEEIKKHPWFKMINFQDLLEKKITPTYVPEIKDDQDLQNFNPIILQQRKIFKNHIILQALQDEPSEKKNEEALKKFDDEFYGITFNNEKLP